MDDGEGICIEYLGGFEHHPRRFSLTGLGVDYSCGVCGKFRKRSPAPAVPFNMLLMGKARSVVRVFIFLCSVMQSGGHELVT